MEPFVLVSKLHMRDYFIIVSFRDMHNDVMLQHCIIYVNARHIGLVLGACQCAAGYCSAVSYKFDNCVYSPNMPLILPTIEVLPIPVVFYTFSWGKHTDKRGSLTIKY